MTPEERKKFDELVNQVLTKDPKEFVDSSNLFIAKEYIALRLTIGNGYKTYALTPTLAKLLSQAFNAQIEGYEKQFGTIQTAVPVVSPVQVSDLGESGDEGKEVGDSEGPDKPSNQ